MYTTLLVAIRTHIVKKSQKPGVKVRCLQDCAYEVDEEELTEYTQQLRDDPEKAATVDLRLYYHTSPTEKD